MFIVHLHNKITIWSIHIKSYLVFLIQPYLITRYAEHSLYHSIVRDDFHLFNQLLLVILNTWNKKTICEMKAQSRSCLHAMHLKSTNFHDHLLQKIVKRSSRYMHHRKAQTIVSKAIIVIAGMGWNYVSMELQPLTGPLSDHQMIHEWMWSIDEMILTKKLKDFE
jgi:hypothetical protein